MVDPNAKPVQILGDEPGPAGFEEWFRSIEFSYAPTDLSAAARARLAEEADKAELVACRARQALRLFDETLSNRQWALAAWLSRPT